MADETSRSDNAEAADSPKGKKGTSGRKGRKSDKRKGPVGKVTMFFREVVEQLRKVVYPTKKQLITYSIVVLIFVLVIMSYIGVLDMLFGDLMQRAFGVS
ncbi:preprotein translocase subunit SecE [Natronoglycomyces albus]|uniref:preprotein translocase subunit SecE n=1 Tax=Natronoglycomyces albus TaxID=2811108 RepID=UPI001BCC544F|nr:preprotein translocase subunit SecE [Natronoglycomyces albus]